MPGRVSQWYRKQSILGSACINLVSCLCFSLQHFKCFDELDTVAKAWGKNLVTQRRNRDRGHYNSNNVRNILGLQKYVSTHDYECFCYEEPDIPKPVFNQRLSTFDSAYCMYSQFVYLLLNIFLFAGEGWGKGFHKNKCCLFDRCLIKIVWFYW